MMLPWFPIPWKERYHKKLSDLRLSWRNVGKKLMISGIDTSMILWNATGLEALIAIMQGGKGTISSNETSRIPGTSLDLQLSWWKQGDRIVTLIFCTFFLPVVYPACVQVHEDMLGWVEKSSSLVTYLSFCTSLCWYY